MSRFIKVNTNEGVVYINPYYITDIRGEKDICSIGLSNNGFYIIATERAEDILEKIANVNNSYNI